MNLTKKEIEILQEQLILIYKLMYQDSTINSFYFKDIDTGKQVKSKSHLISELNKLKNPKSMLKSCIIELEEIKENGDVNDDFFYRIMSEYRLRDLKEKFNIGNVEDIDKLKVERTLKKIN